MLDSAFISSHMNIGKTARHNPGSSEPQGRARSRFLLATLAIDSAALAGSILLIWYGVPLDDRRPLAAGVIALAFALVVLLWIVPHLQVPDNKSLDDRQRIELRDKTRATLAQILGGSLLLVGIFTAAENLRSNKESEFTDRLIRCVQLLGAEGAGGKKQMDSRVGAIHALAEISAESEKETRVVAEILAAYVETNAPRKPTGIKEKDRDKVDPDIQAALNVLVKRDTKHDPPNAWLELSDTQLASADFTAGADVSSLIPGTAADLGRIRLVGSDLSGAFLSCTNLSQVIAKSASLRNAFLNKAVLDRADLSDADLTGAKLIGASLVEADLSHATLNLADLSAADLTDAKVTQIQIESATGDAKTKLPTGLVFPKAWVSP